jgi:trk system potassium uptake protein TrkH
MDHVDLRNRRGSILRAAGQVQMLTSLVVLPSIAVSWYDRDGYTFELCEVFLLMLAIGLLLWLPFRRCYAELRLRDGFLVTTAVWLVTSFACALPLILAPPYLSFTHAVFESVSGLTTTGATVIVGLDALPDSIRLYRQTLCFYGGMGIVVLAVAILPTLRIGGLQLTKGETSGPIKDAKLTPRIAQTAAALWMVYVGLVALCALCFWLAGMSLFNAIGHAFSTVSTAGFSTHDASLGHYNSGLIEVIAIIFMILGGTNFALHFLAWQRGSLRAYWRDPEFRVFLGILFWTSIVLAVVITLHEHHEDFLTGFRHVSFHLVSNMTTTGFTTTGYQDWPGFLPFALILISFFGACAGSTTGGLKLMRIMIIFKQSAREVVRVIHPRAQLPVRLDRGAIPDQTIHAVGGYAAIYTLFIVLITVVVLSTGETLETSFGAAAATLNNLGPGLGETYANFATVSDVAVWAGSLGMLIGRLEIFTILVLFTPAYWRE